MNHTLTPTPMLDYTAQPIQSLIAEQGWQALPEEERIRAVYEYVRDEIPLGFNARDEIPASGVLREGYGQCNTKATLLAALLRGVGIPARLHAAWVDKSLQRGPLSGLFYACTPALILHSWVEAELDGRWYALEGVIVDTAYLTAVQRRFGDGPFNGYAVSTADLQNPPVAFGPGDTFIQNGALAEDLGVFESPDELFARHAQGFTGLRGAVYAGLVRKGMNRRLAAMRREAAVAPVPPLPRRPA